VQVDSTFPPEVSVVLPVTPDEAFALLTEPERLRRWKTVSARVDLRAGGTYRWTIIPGHTVEGTYIEVEHGRRLVFGWGWSGQADLGPDASTVTVTFEPTVGGTLVRLVHTGLNQAQAASHLAGWQHYLARLVSLATSDEVGADEWAAVPDPMTEIACAEAALAICQQAVRQLEERGGVRSVDEDARTRSLIAHVAESLAELARAADGSAADPSDDVGGERRIADLGQQALESWAAHSSVESVHYRGVEARGESVLAWTAIELLTHADAIAASIGRPFAVASAFRDHLRAKAEDLRTHPTPGGGSLADRLQTGLDADVLSRLEALTAAD
jgi:uncharacterized protein YndB with AHSA1/START domain